MRGVRFELTQVKCYSFELSKSMKTIHNTACDAARSRRCVLFPGALGDFICFLPALQDLARDADVDLFAHSEFAEIAPSGVNVGSLERYEIGRLFVGDCADDERLQIFFDAYQSVYSWMGSRVDNFVRRLRSRYGGNAKIFPFRSNDPTVHQVDYYLSCLNRPITVSIQPEIGLRPEAIRWCEDFWAQHSLSGRRVMVIAPGSGAREKNWPEQYFLTVTDWWRETTGGVIVLLLGPVEAERVGVERLRKACLVASDLTLSQVAAVLRCADLYLGNDSGISHLAAALGARTVALFGPSDARQWGPRGKRVTVVRRNIECSPCQNSTMKSCPHHACLTELRPSDVIDRIATLAQVVTLTRVEAGIKV